MEPVTDEVADGQGGFPAPERRSFDGNTERRVR